MRTRLAALVAATVGLSFAPVALAPPASAAPATVKIIVMPVTAAGEAADGFTVKDQDPGYPIDCSFKDPSRGAVSPNIENCSPGAAFAPACWNSAVAHHVLCMQDADKHKLVQFKRVGRFANTPMAKPNNRAPLLIVLTDGTHCKLRIGGAMGPVPHHPNLYAGYYCDRHTAAWEYAKGSHADAHNGIDESDDVWKVRTGYKHIVWRNIAKAYFVGTAS